MGSDAALASPDVKVPMTATNGRSNTTHPLEDQKDIALQEFWARVLAACGDQSVVSYRPKTATGQRRSLPGDHGDAFPDYVDAKKRQYRGMTTQEFRGTLFRHFQGTQPDWIMGHLLRANHYNVELAIQDFFYHISWRKKVMNVDEGLLAHGEAGFIRTINDPNSSKRARAEAEGFMFILRNSVASILRGLDKKNRIIVHVRVRLHKAYTFPGSSYHLLSVYFSEYCRLQMADRIDEVVMLFDISEAGIMAVDDRPLRNFIFIARDVYPQGLGDVIMHRMPRTWIPFWKVSKRLMRPEFVQHIHFTNSLEELQQHIPYDVIPEDMGGGDDFDFSYIEPDLDDPLNGGGGPEVQARRAAERDRLLAERHVLGDSFLAATRRWIEVSRAGRDPADAQAQRRSIADELIANFWQLDPFARARSIFDRWGVLPEPDPEAIAILKP